MDHVTLILTRTPKDEFILDGNSNLDVDDFTEDQMKQLYLRRGQATSAAPSVKRYSGLWGSMLMIRGPEVTAASFGSGPPNGAPMMLAGRPLLLAMGEGAIAKSVEYTTLERYRGNLGRVDPKGRYVMMLARDEPYALRVERGNSVVKTLRTGHSGDCLRVIGGVTQAQKGILIHEAPNVGWVIGCIAPRPKNNKGVFPNRDGNPSYLAMKAILQEFAVFARGKGKLFILP